MKSFLYTILAVTTLLPAISYAAEKPVLKALPAINSPEVKPSKQKEAEKAVAPTPIKDSEKLTEIPEKKPIEETPLEKPKLNALSKPDALIIPPKPGDTKNRPPAVSPEQIITLNEALIAAYNTNPQLKKAIAQLEATNELRPQALAEWLPSAAIDIDYGRKQAKFGTTPKRTSNVDSKLLTVEQPIFKGTLGANTDRADNLIKSARYNFQSVEQQVLLSVVSAYMDLITETQIKQLSGSRVDILKRQLEETDARFEVGELTKTDVSQADARLSAAIAEKSMADTRVVAAKAAFQRIIGTKPKALKVPKELPPVPDNLDDALKTAKDNSPFFNYTKYYEKAAENETDLYVGELLPKLSLVGQSSREADNSFSGQDFENDSIVLNVNIPLYQGGAEYSRVREAKKQASAAKYDRIAAGDQSEEQTRAAWEMASSSSVNIEAMQTAVQAAEVALEGVRAEEDEGLRTIIDVLDAEQELFSAKTSLLTARRDQIIAYYNLLDKIGRLTAENLGLAANIYDADKALDKVKYKFIGF